MRDIYFWRSANDKHSAQNCAGTRSVDIFLAEIDVGSGLKFSEQNSHKCMLQLQSWQPTITFHNFLRGVRELFLVNSR